VRSSRVRLLAAAVTPIILLAACASDDADQSATSADTASATSAGPDDAATTAAVGSDLSQVGVEREDNEDGVSVPQLTYGGEDFADGDLPFGVASTEVQQVSEGEGEEVAEGEQVTVRYLAVNGTTGEELLSTFPTEDTVVMDLSNPSLLPAFLESLPGQQPGAELIMAMPPSEGFGEAGNANLGIGPTDTVLFYVEVVEAVEPLSQAEGTEVEPEEGLPTVEADGTSPATITIPEGEEPPTELVVQPLIEGEREEVTAGQTVTVHYTGVKWSDGEQFDSSLESGQPFSTVIGAGQVIPGWDEGLVGQTVGSRVLLVIPPDLAYGEDPSANLGGETLVFVVDILAAS
jgi:peptidylprolyl isomerase